MPIMEKIDKRGIPLWKSSAPFCKRKDIVFSAKRYGIDALGAMAQGLFCTLLVGTILNTIGTQFHIGFLNARPSSPWARGRRGILHRRRAVPRP